MAERMVQIGVTALRSPSGEFLPSIPPYIKVFADKFKVYAEGTKKRRGKAAKGGISNG